jgi:hypothetical protein
MKSMPAPFTYTFIELAGVVAEIEMDQAPGVPPELRRNAGCIPYHRRCRRRGSEEFVSDITKKSFSYIVNVETNYHIAF